jgi:Xaa-Pro aminopeptidase
MRTAAIPEAEFAERRERARRAAAARGLDALVVVARGGGSLDRYGDVMYLTNHYSPFPFIPDLPGAWSGRAHSALILPVGADPTLVIDIPSTADLRMPEGQIVVTDLVTETLIERLAAADLQKARVGRVGGDAMPATMAEAVRGALPDMVFVSADDILADLRAVKSQQEIAKLRAASALGSRVIEAMMAAAIPGATHGDVVAAGLQVLVPASGMLYSSFMASGQGGEAPTMARSNFPTWGAQTPLATGDWLRLGISGVLDGYYFDLSRSRSIGRASNAQVAAFEAAIGVVEAGIAAIRPGATAGDVARAGNAKQEELGYSWKGVFSGLGHGLGLGWDAPWLVPDNGTILTPGMVLNIEKTLMKDGHLGDFEETVLVTEHGIERLTDAQTRFW